ncbi:hypothetical protein ACQKLN_30435 [Paenibacillus glucanolyticus]|uniref:hypothetical protein n=1 Tax=Paenibacillus glucanolyticus TaxID=59843 RepID=UPI0036989B3E
MNDKKIVTLFELKYKHLVEDNDSLAILLDVSSDQLKVLLKNLDEIIHSLGKFYKNQCVEVLKKIKTSELGNLFYWTSKLLDYRTTTVVLSGNYSRPLLDTPWVNCESASLSSIIEWEKLGSPIEILLEPIFTGFVIQMDPKKMSIKARRQQRTFNKGFYLRTTPCDNKNLLDVSSQILKNGKLFLISAEVMDFYKEEEYRHFAVGVDVIAQKKELIVYDSFNFFLPELNRGGNLYAIPLFYIEATQRKSGRWLNGATDIRLQSLVSGGVSKSWEDEYYSIIEQSVQNLDYPSSRMEGIQSISALFDYLKQIESYSDGEMPFIDLLQLSHTIRIYTVENRYIWVQHFKKCSSLGCGETIINVANSSFQSWSNLSNALLLMIMKKKFDFSIYSAVNAVVQADQELAIQLRRLLKGDITLESRRI